jgi:hypothetical protein
LGRGRSLEFFTILGSYGVVFKAHRVRQKEDSNDIETVEVDEEGKPKEYAIKRIFPTINAAYILIEMLILRLVQGRENITQLL